MPDTPEVASQLALILLIHSRRGARYNDGEYVSLADQDRALWDQALGLTRTESERVFLAARQGELGDWSKKRPSTKARPKSNREV
ncbi:MAG: hypothetical protein L3J30_03020 [Marinosulfonomonas sp.]|nr:hypothetical protein [Marinosulfonomonas sp.]